MTTCLPATLCQQISMRMHIKREHSIKLRKSIFLRAYKHFIKHKLNRVSQHCLSAPERNISSSIGMIAVQSSNITPIAYQCPRCSNVCYKMIFFAHLCGIRANIRQNVLACTISCASRHGLVSHCATMIQCACMKQLYADPRAAHLS
jgi:hypothetical protein